MAKGNNYYSRSNWADLDTIMDMGKKELRSEAAKELKYVRETTHNMLKGTGETTPIRTLSQHPLFKVEGNRLYVSTKGKSEGELRQIIKAAHDFAESQNITRTGLAEWAKNQREKLKDHGYANIAKLSDKQLENLMSMMKDLREAFGDEKSPDTDVVEGVADFIVNNERIKDELEEELKKEQNKKEPSLNKIRKIKDQIDLINKMDIGDYNSMHDTIEQFVRRGYYDVADHTILWGDMDD